MRDVDEGKPSGMSDVKCWLWLPSTLVPPCCRTATAPVMWVLTMCVWSYGLRYIIAWQPTVYLLCIWSVESIGDPYGSPLLVTLGFNRRDD